MKIASIVSLIVSVLCILCLACCIPAYSNFYGVAAAGYKWIEVLFFCLLSVFGFVEVFARLFNEGTARVSLFCMAFISLGIALFWFFVLLIVEIELPCMGFVKAHLDPNGIFPVAVGVMFVIWYLSVSLRCLFRARILTRQESLIRKEEPLCAFQRKFGKCDTESRARNNPYVGAIFCFILFFVVLSYSPLLAIVGGIAVIMKLLLVWFSKRRKSVNVSSKIGKMRMAMNETKEKPCAGASK